MKDFLKNTLIGLLIIVLIVAVVVGLFFVDILKNIFLITIFLLCIIMLSYWFGSLVRFFIEVKQEEKEEADE
jgi:uncharacterized membrane protein YesL